MAKTKRKPNEYKVTQKLKIELQSLISYACYDHNEVTKLGKSIKKEDVQNRMFKLHMPSNNSRDDRISQVDMFLQGKGRFKGLFECDKNEFKVDDVFVIPEFLHNIPNALFKVSKKLVNRQLLTSKTLKNSQDIKPNRTCNHAKEVEANCEKAFALCKQPDSPCKSFNGTWPSGADWHDRVELLRVKHYERHAMDDMDNEIVSDE